MNKKKGECLHYWGCLSCRPALCSPSCLWTLRSQVRSDSKMILKSSTQQNSKSGNEHRSAAQAPPQTGLRPRILLNLTSHKDGGYMDIGYIIFIYTESHKKMPPEDEHEVDLAGVGNLPSKNKTGWKIHTSLAQSLLYSAKKKRKTRREDTCPMEQMKCLMDCLWERRERWGNHHPNFWAIANQISFKYRPSFHQVKKYKWDDVSRNPYPAGKWRLDTPPLDGRWAL